MGKSSRQKNKRESSSSKNKKKVETKKSKLDKFIDESDQISKPKRRLKKMNKRSLSSQSEQEFIPQSQQAFSVEDQINQAQQNQQNQINDNQEDFSQKKIKGKKSKGKKDKSQKNQSKSKSKQKKIKKLQENISKKEQKIQIKPKFKQQEKRQQPKVQRSLFDMFNRIKQRKPEKNQRQSQKKNQRYIDKFQEGLSNVGQNQLIQRAIKLSLLQSGKKQQYKQKQKQKFKQSQSDQHVDLQDFKFQKADKKKPTRTLTAKQSKKQSKFDFLASESQEKPYKKSPPKGKKSASKKSAKKQSKQGPLKDQVIVFTGQFEPYSKDQLIQLCQKLGATTPSTFAVKTTVLLQGAYVLDAWKRKSPQDIMTTNKSKKALQKGIRIVANKDIDDFFIEKTGKSLQEHFEKNPNKLDGFVEKNTGDESNAKMQLQIVDKQKVKHSQKGFSVLWTEKYKPQSLDQVIGEGAQIRQLRQWLTDWQDVVLKGKTKAVEPQRGFMPSGSLNSRAALLSGDPGLGKTTTARLLAQQLNYNIAEFNASDIRNKKGVHLLQSNSFGLHQSAQLVKKLIIMDQVDGMSKGDRGGITQIINMIKNTTVPIICICNDRQSQKIRSLAGHCLDVKFHKPDKRMIVKRLYQILQKEGGKATDLVLNRIIQTFQNDMRQILNYLELMFKTKTSQLQITDIQGTHKFSKDSGVMLTHFDATRKLLNRVSLNSMTLRDKLDCFFIDSDFVPIMVHENYLSSMKKEKLNKQQFHNLVRATEGFVLADQIDARVRKQQQWGLMPSYGFMATVYTSEMVASSLGFPQFPSWLGKFSSERKQKRLLKQLKHVIHLATPSSNKSVKYGQAAILYQQINYMLKKDMVEETLNFLQDYNMNPTILNEVLIPLQFNPQKRNLLEDVSTSTKIKLTRQFNKRHQQLKLQGKKKKNANNNAPQHQKFNQILQQMSDDDFINDEEEDKKNEDDEQEIIVQKQSKKNTKKQTKAGKKK